ncbi:MAG: hypothetical protein IJK77_03590 [Lachnospiraceae bacterium]|nr:hypothetical protein [Lachnospiraceae bacterium]
MKKPIDHEWKGILIIFGTMAVLILTMLCINAVHDRLPEDTGAAVYYSTYKETQGQNYTKLTRGACAIGSCFNNGIWLSENEYRENIPLGGIRYGEMQPLSVWMDPEYLMASAQILIEDDTAAFWFAVKTRGDAKADNIAVWRWPLDVVGTDAVKKDTWTGRERVEYEWKKGGLFSMSKGSFEPEAGYLYSVFVSWTSERLAMGWEEYCFVMLTPEQAGITVYYPD